VNGAPMPALEIPARNTQWLLSRRPQGEVRREDFTVRTQDIPQPQPGQVLVRNIYLMVPPSMRLWMNEEASYLPTQQLGAVMTGGTLGVVVASDDPRLPVGRYVNGLGGWQHYYLARVEELLPLSPDPRLPLAVYRSVLDVQGLTAWCGLVDVGRPQAGETMVVTAAAGNVGSLVCQIGRKLGLKVIGIAGSAEKCRWLVEDCGIDAAIDYKTEDVAARLDALCPQGVDLLFENVGGAVTDLVMARMRKHARIVLCGLIAGYNGQPPYAYRSLMQLVYKSVRMEGFVVLDYVHRYPEVIERLQPWLLDGSLRYQLECVDGLDQVVDALNRVFRGENRGMQLVRLTPETA